MPWLLTLDRGNSTLDACLWQGDIGRYRGRRRRRFGVADRLDALPRWVEHHGAVEVAAIGATVVPGGLDVVRETLACMNSSGFEAACLETVPMEVDYATPDTLGVDRVLACLGARELGAGPFVVVDCGTATTVNAVDGDGVFRGGAIGPGLDAMAAAMGRATPFLPGAEPAALERLPARSSAGAVAAGVWIGWVGLVDRLIDDCAAPAARILVTGGRASHLVRHARRQPLREVPDLVHRGLVRTWEARCGS